MWDYNVHVALSSGTSKCTHFGGEVKLSPRLVSWLVTQEDFLYSTNHFSVVLCSFNIGGTLLAITSIIKGAII